MLSKTEVFVNLEKILICLGTQGVTIVNEPEEIDWA